MGLPEMGDVFLDYLDLCFFNHHPVIHEPNHPVFISVPTWRNWQTRYVQGVVLARGCRFKSYCRHHLFYLALLSKTSSVLSAKWHINVGFLCLKLLKRKEDIFKL